MLGGADEVIGRLLHLSTLHCPDLAKAWYSLASWGYKWGRKALDIFKCQVRCWIMLDNAPPGGGGRDGSTESCRRARPPGRMKP